MSKSKEMPKRFWDFVELREFTRQWDSLGLDIEGDLAALQLTLMHEPLQGKLVKGTHGLRKTRFAPPSWNVGKSGACRVLYVCFLEFATVLLCFVYAKNERADISASDKRLINKWIDEYAKQKREKQ